MVKWRYVAAGGAAVIVLLAGGVFYKNITKHYDNMAADGIGIARTVGPNEWHNELEQEDLENNHDARSADISGLQIHKLTAAEPYLDFNTKTIWPADLAGYQPEKIMELGKNPGLNVRKLQEAGIDGSGVAIAIIDQVLMTGHEEYKDNLVHYEEMYVAAQSAQMHGSAVSSIAVGKTVGVAPGSSLYFIAADVMDHYFAKECNYEYYANAINHLLDINGTLPEEERIRAISISKGFGMYEKNADKLMQAIDRAKAENVLVVTTSMENYYDYGIGGLGKQDIMGDPDSLDTYTIGYFEREAVDYFADSLLIPMDGRTYAGFTGEKDYEWGYSGGLSWTCPYLAGVYALAVQVKPEITPDEFLTVCRQTADSKAIELNGQEYVLSYILNPTALIEALQNK